MADLRDFTGKNRKFKGAAGITVSDTGLGSGDRVDEKGRLRFNDSTDLLEYYTGVEWKSIDAPPVVTSINIDGAGAAATGFINSSLSGNTTIVIAGSLFDPSNASVTLEASSGSNISPTTTTNDSSNQITITAPYSSFVNANEPYTVKVTNPSGLSAQLEQAINVDTAPTFTNAADTTYNIFDGARSGITIAAADLCGATDAEGDTITYSVSSGSLPSGLSLNTSTAVITGSVSAVGTDTTSTFSITAAQNGGAGNSTRQFKITVKAPQVQSYTSTGAFTFANPTGIAALDVLVIAGGGGARWGGGGAGGMIYRPAFPVSPGSTIPGNVGAGGGRTTLGQDSAFSTLTAKGGGHGGDHGPSSPANGNAGGSGGGVGRDGGPGGSGGPGTQPGQPGESGNYGHGNPGGPNPHGMSGWQGAGGGGGAGGSGQPGSPHHPGDESGGPGGSGRSNNITGSSVTYAGGGGGGCHPSGGRPAGSAGPGGGGTGSKGGQGTDGGANQGGGAGGGNNMSSGGPGVVILRY